MVRDDPGKDWMTLCIAARVLLAAIGVADKQGGLSVSSALVY
jgi:hypothetical protein